MTKKILMILDREFPPDIRVEKEAAALIDAGFQVHIACFTKSKGKKEYEVIDGIHVHRKHICKFTFKTNVAALKFPFYFNYWRKYIREIFLQDRFDAIHIHDLPLAKVGIEIREKFGIPVILDLHENWPAFLQVSAHTNTFLGKMLSTDNQWFAYELEMAGKADAVICVVDEMKERLGLTNNEKAVSVQNTFPFSEKEITSDHRGVDVKFYFVGGITPIRGLDIIVDGFSKLTAKYENIKLIIAGDGSDLESIKQRASEKNVSEMIEFTGWVKQDKALELMKCADIMLLPHKRHIQTDCSSPNKLYQYMYSAKPILASDCKSIERVINETDSGLVYKYDDPDSFAECAEKLIENPELRIKLGINGYNAVKNKYNWENDSEKLVELYDRILKCNS